MPILSILMGPVGKILAVLLLAAGLFIGGFVKGLNYEHDKIGMEQAQLVAKEVNDAAKLNKILSDELFATKEKEKAIISQSDDIKARYQALINSRPKTTEKACDLSDAEINLFKEATSK